MKVLFQSGTFISAENLNLLSLAANDSGIVKGCKVYKDMLTNSLKIGKPHVLSSRRTLYSLVSRFTKSKGFLQRFIFLMSTFIFSPASPNFF